MSEYDDLLGRGEYRERSRDELRDERDAARADLAAANARIAELEAMDAEWVRRVGQLNSHGERADLIAERNKATRERDEARSEAQRQEAAKTCLQARIDKALAACKCGAFDE